MPKPLPKETRNSFMRHCVPQVMEEDKCTNEQAVGKCEGIFTYNMKKKSGMMMNENK